MIILGIDPGSRITGYGLIKAQGNRYEHIDNGIIRPKTTRSYAERLHDIYNGLIEVLAQHQPQCVAIEEVFVAKNVRSALHLGQARGVALLACIQSGLQAHEYSTRVVKQCVVGNGNANKQQIQFMTQRLLGLPEPATEDAADALALAMTHAHHGTTIAGLARSRPGKPRQTFR